MPPQVKRSVSHDRGIEAEALESLMHVGSFSAVAGVSHGLIDELGFRVDQLPPPPKTKNGKRKPADSAPVVVGAKRFVKAHQKKWKRRMEQQAKKHGIIAVVSTQGDITSGRSNPRGGSIGADSIVSTLEKALGDEAVKAVVLHIDSGGTSLRGGAGGRVRSCCERRRTTRSRAAPHRSAAP